jgi:hypothetical protein
MKQNKCSLWAQFQHRKQQGQGPLNISLSFNMTLETGMHNIRPAGKMWPAEALYLARQPYERFNIINLTVYYKFRRHLQKND